jgi:hypothetical protein
MTLCECGCGHPTLPATMTRAARGIKKGEPLRFLHGHNIHSWHGPAHPQWIDGRANSVAARSAYNREYLKQNYPKYRERHLVRCKAYREANPDLFKRLKLRKFGLTATDYDRIFAEQGGVCAICRKQEKRTFKGRVTLLAVDHDHQTGCVRGLLCSFCNTAIGLFRENPEIMLSAMAYLAGGKAIQALDGGVSVYDKTQVPHA